VFVVCFAGSGFCDELITLSEESYWLCVCVCSRSRDIETSKSRLRPNLGCSTTNTIIGRHLSPHMLLNATLRFGLRLESNVSDRGKESVLARSQIVNRNKCLRFENENLGVHLLFLFGRTRSKTFYEGWNFNSGNYLFTTDTK